VGACAGSTISGASCQASGDGLSNCGSASESCCTSLEVPGGTYYRTYDNDGSGATKEADPATVSGFRLDKYDVTVGRFRQFVEIVLPAEGGVGWSPAAGSGIHGYLNGGLGLVNTANPGTFESGWVTSNESVVAPTDANLTSQGGTWTSSPGSQENLPMTGENWYEAYAFCIWDGGFLPSEAEWEFAAVGGNQQREYPWGSTAPGEGNQYAIYGDGNGNCYYPYDALADCNGVSNVAPVGTPTLGAGLWGQLDLAGEAWEWVLDGFSSYADPCINCGYLTDASWQVIRGGAYYEPLTYILPAYRYRLYPHSRAGDTGFRCARDP